MRERVRWLFMGLVISVVWVASSSPALGERLGPFPEVVNGSPIITVLPQDAIPAIDAPTFVSAKAADRVMTPGEPVLGVTDGQVAKAYSLWQLNHHEIVNDQIGILPVAVTW